jgi:hypothetical protein
MNRIRGEATLVAAGKSYCLLLTLGALAEIEDGLALANLSEIGARLKGLRAADLAIVAASLLRGGGHDMTPADVLRLPCSLGEVARAVTEAFAAAVPQREAGGEANQKSQTGGEASQSPFVGSGSSPSASAS